ncbi:procathepsin L-like [Latimeria chalumnae]|uniref:Cathepsin K n=1 Tax=Latimeria chalumnae TaxID=7897 RepID=H3BEF4_LATCH|nr:PREDICTED: cathepsin L1-like [Latimeria chalumnae]XP_005992024.1 PREDICTED: cathepsin L1-like [Latimeria chalumnae]|eukprot:XP_005992023.1 PREDICTED: cathepsin L1-like [Latimeria chalumnae]
MKWVMLKGCISIVLLTLPSSFTFDPALEESWRNWKTLHMKRYPLEAEESYRRLIWENNLRYIERHNLEFSMGKHSYSLGMNKLGDLTSEEFRQLVNGFISDDSKREEGGAAVFSESSSFQIPKEIDWRKKGYVTPIKYQGHCGSCWAFSATGALEGQIFKKTSKLISLSEQNLIDCSKTLGNMGCNGGYITRAFEYVKRNGINSEKYYPYLERDDQQCRYDPKQSVGNCTSITTIPRGKELALEKAVALVGPVSVAADASLVTFRFYRSGIFHDPKCSSKVNHAMLAVGYGVTKENGETRKYWIIKNSWGEHWGEKGFIRLAKEMGNHCGIANQASFPII